MSSNPSGEAFQELMVNARKEINESIRHYGIKAKYELYAPDTTVVIHPLFAGRNRGG